MRQIPRIRYQILFRDFSTPIGVSRHATARTSGGVFNSPFEQLTRKAKMGIRCQLVRASLLHRISRKRKDAGTRRTNVAYRNRRAWKLQVRKSVFLELIPHRNLDSAELGLGYVWRSARYCFTIIVFSMGGGWQMSWMDGGSRCTPSREGLRRFWW